MLNLQQIFNFDHCWIFLITWISILLMIYSNQWLKRINRITNYRISSLKEGFFMAVLFLLFIYYFYYLHIYRWFFEAKTINVWDIVYEIWVFFEPFNFIIISLAFIWLIGCLFLFLVIMQALKLWLKKSYFVILQIKPLAAFIAKTLFETWHLPIRLFIYRQAERKILFDGFTKKLVHHYIRHGYSFAFMLLFFCVFFYDILFNNGNLIYAIKIMPYYLILILLHSIHSFLVMSRGPIQDTIISDIYYNFDNPRLSNFQFARDCICTLNYYYGMKMIDESHISYEKNKYYAYRIYLDSPESVTAHTLHSTLTKEEKKRRIRILKKIGIYLN